MNLTIKPIRILIAEDVPADAELVKREINKSVQNVSYKIVETRSDFTESVIHFKPDIVITDYRMPTFDGMSAIKIVFDLSPLTPVIVVTGSLNEEIAVNCLKSGAVDYVLKESLKRIGQAVLNALEQKHVKQDKLNAEKALVESEERFRRLTENAQDLIYRLEIVPEKRLSYISSSALHFTGYSPEEHYNNFELFFKLVYSDDQNIAEDWTKTEKEIRKPRIYRWIRKDEKVIWSEHRNIPIYDQSGILVAVEGIARDITKQRITEGKLKLLSRAIQQNPVSIVITDTKGNIEYVNPAFIRKSGYSADEVIGQNPRILKSGHQPAEFYKEMWDSILSGKEWIGEFRNKGKNGELFWEEVVISAITNEYGEITHFVAVKEDITNKKKMIEDLIISKEKAEESDRLKSAFLANMSHEIRTPMNGILGFANLLKEPHLTSAEKEHFIEIIENSGQRMLNTINDLMDIAKIESGVIEVTNSNVQLQEILQSLYYFFQPEASKKGLMLINASASEQSNKSVVTDKEMLMSVLTNLIKNSVKYTSSGRIEFGFISQPESVLFFVKDTGIGIDKLHQQAIFERFVQEDNSISRAFEGAGLGLSISKAYVELLGGKIWVESVKGEGSQFFFTIPVKNVNTENLEEMVQVNSLPDSDVLEGLTILIAEDDNVGQLFLAAILEKKCKKLLYAENGEEAVEMAITNNDVDLVLMDMKMPVMDGFIATQKIKSIRPEILIIAQTAFAMTNDREMAIKAGCDAYITKPVNKDQLIKLIKDHFTARAM
jgi:PAS domain S-box-containing protein